MLLFSVKDYFIVNKPNSFENLLTVEKEMGLHNSSLDFS